MSSGFYLAAIVGAVSSFFIGCIWYSLIFGKSWQKEMNFSDEKVKQIFVPKRILFAFVCEWMASFCTIGIFNLLSAPLVYKVLMLGTVIVFQGIKLAIFDGKNLKTILINEGYLFINIVVLATTYSLFLS